MPKTVPELGERVNRILRNRKWSERRAAAEAKARGEQLSLSTIQGMSDGVVPAPHKVLAFARTVDYDPDKLLGLCGWPLRYDPAVLEDTEDPERRGAGCSEALALAR